MTIYEVPECSDSLLQTILTIWEASVRATHHFLSDAEIVRIREYVPQAVRAVEHLVLAEDASGTAVAFLGAEGHRLEIFLKLLNKLRTLRSRSNQTHIAF